MLLAALNRSECDTIASYRENGPDTEALSDLFRGSAHRAQPPLEFPSDCGSEPESASRPAADSAASSLADLDSETLDRSSERTVVRC